MAGARVKNHKPSQRWKKYKVQGDSVKREVTCPKCGPGMFLSIHKDRVYCGKCHYVEMKQRPSS